MRNPRSDFPVTHDTYLKLFQLSCPEQSRRWNTILFDEAQDANLVISALVLGQTYQAVKGIPDDVEHYAVLSRTVAGVIGAALSASLKGKNVLGGWD